VLKWANIFKANKASNGNEPYNHSHGEAKISRNCKINKSITFPSVVLDAQLEEIFGQFLQFESHGEPPGVRIDQRGVYTFAVHEPQSAQIAVERVANEDGGGGKQTQQGYLHLQ